MKQSIVSQRQFSALQGKVNAPAAPAAAALHLPDNTRSFRTPYQKKDLIAKINAAVKAYTEQKGLAKSGSARGWKDLAASLPQDASALTEEHTSTALRLFKDFPPQSEKSMAARILVALNSSKEALPKKGREDFLASLLADKKAKDLAQFIHTALTEYLSEEGASNSSNTWVTLAENTSFCLSSSTNEGDVEELLKLFEAFPPKTDDSMGSRILGELQANRSDYLRHNDKLSFLRELLAVPAPSSAITLSKIIDAALRKHKPSDSQYADWDTLKGSLFDLASQNCSFDDFTATNSNLSADFIEEMLKLFSNLTPNTTAAEVLQGLGGQVQQFTPFSHYKMRFFLYHHLGVSLAVRDSSIALPEPVVYGALNAEYRRLIKDGTYSTELSVNDLTSASSVALKLIKHTLTKDVENPEFAHIAGTFVHNSLQYILQQECACSSTMRTRVHTAWLKIIESQPNQENYSEIKSKLASSGDVSEELRALLEENDSLVDAAVTAFNFGFHKGQLDANAANHILGLSQTQLLSNLLDFGYTKPSSYDNVSCSRTDFECKTLNGFNYLNCLNEALKEILPDTNDDELLDYCGRQRKMLSEIQSWLPNSGFEASTFEPLITALTEKLTAAEQACHERTAAAFLVALSDYDSNDFVLGRDRNAYRATVQSIRDWLDSKPLLSEQTAAKLQTELQGLDAKVEGASTKRKAEKYLASLAQITAENNYSTEEIQNHRELIKKIRTWKEEKPSLLETSKEQLDRELERASNVLQKAEDANLAIQQLSAAAAAGEDEEPASSSRSSRSNSGRISPLSEEPSEGQGNEGTSGSGSEGEDAAVANPSALNAKQLEDYALEAENAAPLEEARDQINNLFNEAAIKKLNIKQKELFDHAVKLVGASSYFFTNGVKEGRQKGFALLAALYTIINNADVQTLKNAKYKYKGQEYGLFKHRKFTSFRREKNMEKGTETERLLKAIGVTR